MTDIRRARLKEWFADKTLPTKEKSYLSQLMTGKASFGEKAARRLEVTYGMPQNFLDSADSVEKKKSLTDNQLLDAERLKIIFDKKKQSLGITQQAIANELNITQGAVGHYLNGRNALNVPVASAFARILQVSISDFSPTLAHEANSYSGVAEPDVIYAAEYKPGKRYPLISNVQAGAWAEAIEPYTVDQIAEWYESDAHIQGEGFWLKVTGDSMTAPAGLSIPEGTLVLVDTGREAISGSLVIAKLSDSNEATFKKLVIDGGQRYLKGLNPNWPIVPINGNCKIIGVAVETKMKLI